MLSSLCLMLVLKYHRQEKLPHQGVRFIIDERTQHQMSGINHVLMDPDAFHEEEFTSCCLCAWHLFAAVVNAVIHGNIFFQFQCFHSVKGKQFHINSIGVIPHVESEHQAASTEENFYRLPNFLSTYSAPVLNIVVHKMCVE